MLFALCIVAFASPFSSVFGAKKYIYGTRKISERMIAVKMRVLGVLLFNVYPFNDLIAKNFCVILALFLGFCAF